MKTASNIAVLLLSLCLSACGEPKQKFETTVVDETGKPMPGVECKAWFKKAGKSSPYKDYSVSGRTDAEGKLELEGETIWAPTLVEANAPGCYQSIVSDIWITGRSGGRWQPWPVKLDLVMKKIRSPHPMCAVACGANYWFSFPQSSFGKAYGFDLMEGDWVAPHGRGKTSDFLISAQLDDPNDKSYDPKGWVVLKFSNPADGIRKIEGVSDGGSEFPGPSEAPLKGYVSEWRFPNKGGPTRRPVPEGRVDGPSVYVFRVRSKLDESGKIISARYGKIYGILGGSLYYRKPAFRMTYYVNGKDNERNLEWDMKTNLLLNLPKEHWPEQP